MGYFIRSENSLNQHIKLKHPEEWEKIKHHAGEQREGAEGDGEGDGAETGVDKGDK